MMTAVLFGKVGFIITIGKNSSFFEKKTDNNVWEYKKEGILSEVCGFDVMGGKMPSYL